MARVRVFVSSPGDAIDERKRVVRIVETLNAAFAQSIMIEPILWETRYYSAHAGFQPQIAKSSECDVVVAILKGRLGTPLSPEFVRALPPEERPAPGETYPSGTAYEIMTAIEARRRGHPLPDIYVFRQASAPSISLDAPNRAETEAQWESLKRFAERVFVSPEGHFKGAYHTFSSADDFEAQAEAALRQWLTDHVLKPADVVWPIATMGSPFRGLEPFGAKYAEVFFGREGDRLRAIGRLKAAAELGFPFLMIVGPSGAGKSSFARAGLLPALTKAGAVAEVGLWRSVVMRPSDFPGKPLAAFVKRLFSGERDIPEIEAGQPIALPELAHGESRTPEALTHLFTLLSATGAEDKATRAAIAAPIERALAEAAEADRLRWGATDARPARLLIVVDQFEEAFSAEVAENAQTAFAIALQALIESGAAWVVATLRADAYDQLMKSPFARLLRPVLNATRAAGRAGEAGPPPAAPSLVYELFPPGLPEMAELIRRPAQAAGLQWDVDKATSERLDERLLKDVDKANLLPLVQFVLERLFEARETIDGRSTLTFAAYRALGTLDGAVDAAAEAALAKLDAGDLSVVPRIVRALVLRAPTNAAGGRTAPAIRQAPLAEAAFSPAARRVIDALVAARMLVAGEDQTHAPVVGFAHQRVIEAWERARTAIAESAKLLRIRDDVENARGLWEESGGRADRLLPAGLPLSEAQAAAAQLGDELSEATRRFVARSSRRARKKQSLAVALAGIFLLTTVVAGWEWLQANRARELADQALIAATNESNELINDFALKFRAIAGLDVETIVNILNHARHLQDELAAKGATNRDLALAGAAALKETAETLLRIGRTGEALAAAQRSLDVLRSLSPPGAQDRAVEAALAGGEIVLGDVYKGRGELTKALEAYRSAETSRKGLEARFSDDVVAIADLAVAEDRVGDVLLIEAKDDQSLEAYEASQTLRMKAAGISPDDPIRKSDLAWSRSNIGDARLARGEIDEARREYEESLRIRKDLSDSEPQNRQWRRDMSLSLDRIADTLRKSGDLGLALDRLGQSLKIRQLLAVEDHSNLEWHDDLAHSYDEIGDLEFAERNFSEADDADRRGVEILDGLVESDPNAALWKSDLALAELSLGDVFNAEDSIVGARREYQLGEARLRALVAEDPVNVGWRLSLARALFKLAPFQPNRAATLDEAARIVAEVEDSGLLPASERDLPDLIAFARGQAPR